MSVTLLVSPSYIMYPVAKSVLEKLGPGKQGDLPLINKYGFEELVNSLSDLTMAREFENVCSL